MTQIKSSKIGRDCNTKSRSYCFTLNNYTEKDIEILLAQFTPALLYIFQEEIGEINKIPHLQGVVKFKNAKHFSAMKKLHPKAHWERCRDIASSVKYCSKNKTRNGNIWKKNTLRYENFKKLTQKLEYEKFDKWRILYMNVMLKNILSKDTSF